VEEYINKSKDIFSLLITFLTMDNFIEKMQLSYNEEQEKANEAAKLQEHKKQDIEITEVKEIPKDTSPENQTIELSKPNEPTKELTKKVNEHSVNLDFVLMILNKYLDCVNLEITNDFKYENMIGIFELSINLETIKILLSKNIIFKNLVKNKSLLSEFINKYMKMKDLAANFKQIMNSVKNSENINTNEKTIFLINEICDGISITCSNFVSTRCKDQLVYLFKEYDIYRMLLIKDLEFLKYINSHMDSKYKVYILHEDNIPKIIKRYHDEEYDDDNLYNLAESIFSKEIIKFLEYPEETVQFLSVLSEGLKIEMSTDGRTFFQSLYSYFYLWKTIMSKIENGFKLYTTNKGYVETIDNYKIILKLIVNYFERNKAIYEMFLLISISFMHLIDADKLLESTSEIIIGMDKFDDSMLSTTNLDVNLFYFIINILYKFVKIFPSLVKYWFEESKNKMKITFKNIISTIIFPKMSAEIKEKLNVNKVNNIYLIFITLI